jgi:hypothetical protein
MNPSTMDRANEVIRIKVPPGKDLIVHDINFREVLLNSMVICSKKHTYNGYVDD